MHYHIFLFLPRGFLSWLLWRVERHQMTDGYHCRRQLSCRSRWEHKRRCRVDHRAAPVLHHRWRTPSSAYRPDSLTWFDHGHRWETGRDDKQANRLWLEEMFTECLNAAMANELRISFLASILALVFSGPTLSPKSILFLYLLNAWVLKSAQPPQAWLT